MNDNITYGVIGTAVGAIGTSLSVTELQAIISIVVTVAGFIISVLVPLGYKLYKQIKKALEDKKITKEEANEILDTVEEIVDKTKEEIDKHGN